MDDRGYGNGKFLQGAQSGLLFVVIHRNSVDTFVFACF